MAQFISNVAVDAVGGAGMSVGLNAALDMMDDGKINGSNNHGVGNQIMTSMAQHGVRSAVGQSGIMSQAKNVVGDILDDGKLNNSNRGASGRQQIQQLCSNKTLCCAVFLMLILGALVPFYIGYKKPQYKSEANKAALWCLCFFPYGWYLTWKVASKAYM